MNEHYQHPIDAGQLPAITSGRQVAVYNPYTVPDHRNDELDLRRIWQIIRRYRWLILSIVAVSVITTLILTLMMRPVYRATALVELKPNPSIISLDSTGRNHRNARDFRNTQSSILQSESVVERVIKKTNLAEDPEFTGELKQRGLSAGIRTVKSTIVGLGAMVAGSLTPSDAAENPEEESDSHASPEDRQKRALLNRYMQKLHVEQLSDSDLVKVSFESFSPRTAAALANAHTSEYISFIDERRFNSTSSAKRYLQEQIEEAEANLEASEKKLTDFARQHNIVDVEDRGNVMEKRFEDLSRAVTEVRQERIIAETTYKQALDSDLETLPAVTSNQMIRELQERYATLRADYQEMSSMFKDNYPKMRQLKSKLDDVKAMLREESNKLVTGMKEHYEQLTDQERELSLQLEEQRTELLDLKERAISYNILKREWEANRELYSGLLSRQKDFSVAAGLEFNDATILDKAVTPTTKYKPDNVKNVAMAGVFGLVGGMGIAFLLAFLDNTFKTREELEQALGIPFMGIVPNIAPTRENRLVPTSLISAYQPASAIAEAVRSIRTGLLYARPEHVPKTILVTSTMSGEGKSTIVMNLALILAQSGSRVLIIDADLRRPVIGTWLNVASDSGLAEHLRGEETDVVEATSFENLFVVPAGRECSHPTDLLASLRMRDYLKTVSERFDFVILDGPPCLGVADSMLLSTKVDGTLLVVKAGSTERHIVAETVNRLRLVNAPLIGSILNFVSLEQPEYGYYGTYYGSHDDGKRKEMEIRSSGPR